MDVTTILYLKSTNDINGNPRRGWLVVQPDVIKFVDEGYAGPHALREAGFDLTIPWAAEIKISASEYRRMKREYR